MGIRPEDLRVVPGNSAEDRGMMGKVVLVERLGGTSHIHFDVGPHRFLALVSGDPLPDVGDVISVHVPPARVHLFGADGGSA
jgi:ABC-type sugar transport system ATPase subunit